MARNTHNQTRTEEILGELAELGLMVAKELAVRLRESEDAQETVALAGAFQKMSRTVRLTLALNAKLDRDAARDAAAEARTEAEAQAQDARAAEQRRAEEARAAQAAEPVGPAEVRKARVYNLVRRLLWNESEGEDETFEMLTDELDTRLDEAAHHPEFLDMPVETLAKRILADFGITAHFALSLGEPRPPPAPARELQAADTG